jgi:two-component system sensor histidine kinase UhpB
MRRPALSTQILAVNTTLIAATVFAAAVASRLQPEASLHERRHFLVLVAAILATILVNGFVLRRRFAALQQLAMTMERVDLARPGVRVPPAQPADSDEVVRLHEAFNRMLERLEEERSAAASAVLRAQEDERARLARDLHDEVNQALTGVLLRLQASVQDAPPHLAEELRETQAVAAAAMDQLRRLAHELRPTAFDDHGLVAALRSLVDDFTRKTGTACRLDLSGDVDGFRSDEQLVVYRVVQEALSNVTRHAHAEHVRVEVRRKGARGVVRVTDDGCGLDPDGRTGHGLMGMRERALHAGGVLEIRSEPGGGTTVEVLLGRLAPPAAAGVARRAWA